MSVIWTLKSRLARRRKQQGLPPIEDPNDIPDPKDQADYVSVCLLSILFMDITDELGTLSGRASKVTVPARGLCQVTGIFSPLDEI